MQPGKCRFGLSLVRAGIMVAVAACVGASPSQAQTHTWALGLTGGGSFHNDLTPGLPAPTTFEPGWIVGLQADRWFGSGRVGLRLNTLWTQRQLDRTGYYNYNVFLGDVDVLVRPLPTNSRGIAPFLVAGVGATHYGGVAGTAPLGDGVYGDPVIRAHTLLGLGADATITRSVGVRLEVADNIVLPSIGQSPDVSGFPNVHNVVATAGLQLLLAHSAFGRARMRPTPPAREPTAQTEPEALEEAAAGPQRDSLVAALRTRLAHRGQEIRRLEAEVDSLKGLLEAGEPARATPSPDTAESPTPTPREGVASFTVQLDAYMAAGTADRWVRRLRQLGLPAWRVDSELGGSPVSVVRFGALPTESEARTLAELVEQQFDRTTLVDRIEGDEPVPASAVADSRAYLEAR